LKSKNAQHLALGAAGEAQASRHLRRSGYRIIGRNVRVDGVEIDLIIRRGRLIAFVEVKTRRSQRLGPPEAAIDLRKCRRLCHGAQVWLQQQGGISCRPRMDVVACEVRHFGTPKERWSIRHIEHAFDASDGRAV